LSLRKTPLPVFFHFSLLFLFELERERKEVDPIQKRKREKWRRCEGRTHAEKQRIWEFIEKYPFMSVILKCLFQTVLS
jgi:hypothetical protein